MRLPRCEHEIPRPNRDVETRRLSIKMSLNGPHLHYVVARHRAEILLSSKLTGEDVSRLVLARKKGPLRESLTEFPSSSRGVEGKEENRSRRIERKEF